MHATSPQRRWRRWLARTGWLVLIWAASVTVLGAAAWAMRLLMNAGGLSA